MERGERKGKVQTTLGVIEPDDLGITLMHEHLLTDVQLKYFTYHLKGRDAGYNDKAPGTGSVKNFILEKYFAKYFIYQISTFSLGFQVKVCQSDHPSCHLSSSTALHF